MTEANFKYDVFVSYSHKDKTWVRGTFLPKLKEQGLKIWIDFESLQIGAPVLTTIEKALMTSRRVCLIFTEDYLKSEWGEFENLLPQTIHPTNKELQIVPVLLKKCDLPPRFSSLYYVNFTKKDKYIDPWKKLFFALGVSNSTKFDPPKNTSKAFKPRQITHVTTDPSTIAPREATVKNTIKITEENELKFMVSEETQAKLASIKGKEMNEVREVLRTVKAALNLAEFDISQEKVEGIIDEYFDTENLALYGFHASIRVRRSLGKTIVTAKKLKAMEQGQFSRDEISRDITEEVYSELVRAGFGEFVAQALPDIKGERLSHVLRINNERRAFQLKRNNEQYELALDLFTFTNPHNNETGEVKCEVEIEAINPAAKSKLSSIRRNLIDIVTGFDFSRDSKYEKGIKYFGLDKPSWRRWFQEKWNTPKGLAWIGIIVTVTTAIIGIILTILFGR